MRDNQKTGVPEKGAHGEPWTFDSEGKMWTTPKSKELSYEQYVERTLACVNALDGMNPDALAGLIKAVNEMLEEKHIADFEISHREMDMAFAEEVPDYKADCESISRAFDAVRNAIAKLKG